MGNLSWDLYTVDDEASSNEYVYNVLYNISSPSHYEFGRANMRASRVQSPGR